MEYPLLACRVFDLAPPPRQALPCSGARRSEPAGAGVSEEWTVTSDGGRPAPLTLFPLVDFGRPAGVNASGQ